MSNDQEVREIAIEALFAKSSQDNFEQLGHFNNKSGLKAADEYLARMRYDRQFKLRAEKCINESELEIFLQQEGYDFTMKDLSTAKEKYTNLKTATNITMPNAQKMDENGDKNNSEQRKFEILDRVMQHIIRDMRMMLQLVFGIIEIHNRQLKSQNSAMRKDF